MNFISFNFKVPASRKRLPSSCVLCTPRSAGLPQHLLPSCMHAPGGAHRPGCPPSLLLAGCDGFGMQVWEAVLGLVNQKPGAAQSLSWSHWGCGNCSVAVSWGACPEKVYGGFLAKKHLHFLEKGSQVGGQCSVLSLVSNTFFSWNLVLINV